MEIKKFSELETWKGKPVSSNKPSQEVIDYVVSFQGSVDNTIENWVEYISDKYNVNKFNVINSKFAKDNNLKSIEDYFDNINESKILLKKLNKLEKKRNKLYFRSSNELLYNFQEYLVQNNFNLFRELFIDESIPEDEPIQFNYGWFCLNTEVHPEIYKDYEDEIKLKLEASKYNL